MERKQRFEAFKQAYEEVEKIILESGLDKITTKEFETLNAVTESIDHFRQLIYARDINYEHGRGERKMMEELGIDIKHNVFGIDF